MAVLRRYLLEVLLGAAAFFAVVAIAFGTADRAERWSYNRTEYSPTGNSSNSYTVTGAVPNEVSGRAAFGFASLGDVADRRGRPLTTGRASLRQAYGGGRSRRPTRPHALDGKQKCWTAASELWLVIGFNGRFAAPNRSHRTVPLKPGTGATRGRTARSSAL